MHPGQKNNLDALCKRYEIDNSARDLHGALLDAEILAEVYLAMTGGQVRLSLDGMSETAVGKSDKPKPVSKDRSPLKVIRANETELAAHTERLGAIEKASDGQCVWLKSKQ
jgi:DNA polymerase-3 subunit epsilon